MSTPPSASASMIVYTYAGPLPLRPVTASSRLSFTRTARPTPPKIFCAISASASVACVPVANPDAPASTSAGVFGITRMMRNLSPAAFSRLAIERPATMEIRSLVSFPPPPCHAQRIEDSICCEVAP